MLYGYLAHCSAQARKNKTNPLGEKILIFREMEFSNSKIKEFLIFSQKKAFLIFPEMEPCTFWPEPSNIFPKIISYIFS